MKYEILDTFSLFTFQGVAAGSQHHVCVCVLRVFRSKFRFKDDGTVRVTKRRHQCPEETTGAKMTREFLKLLRK